MRGHFKTIYDNLKMAHTRLMAELMLLDGTKVVFLCEKMSSKFITI